MLINYIFSALTDVGKVRSVNEDNLGEAKTPNGHLFIVCDGMGGHQGGATASKMAVNCIKEYINNNKSNSYEQLIEEAISFANFQIHATASTNPELSNMGTTCVVLLIANDNKVYYGHVGDSRIYRFNKSGLKRITKDHSFVQFLVDSGEITEAEMETHPSRNQILKALGIDESVKPSIGNPPIVAESNDLFLLCSDGLTGMVTDDIIKSILSEIPQNGLDKTNRKLIDLANENGGKDNITSLLVKFGALDDTTMVLTNQKQSVEKTPTNNKMFLLIGLLSLLVSIFLLKNSFIETTVINNRETTADTTKAKSPNNDKTEEKKDESKDEKKDTVEKKKTDTKTDKPKDKKTVSKDSTKTK